MQSEPLVSQYDDFRVFLKDVYDYRKTLHKKYSYRSLAQELGFEASNFLHLIITGKRNLSLDAIHKIKNHFNWTAQHKKYFHFLVLCNQSNEVTEKQKYKTELEKILGKNRQMLSEDQYAYFSMWYLPVLKELVALKGFVSNLNWISKKLKPRVPEDSLRKGLAILERLNMIRQIKNKWQQTSEHLTTPIEITSDLIHNYHKQMLELSHNALNLPAQVRDVSAMTMSLSKKQFEWLKQRVVDFRDEIQQELQGMKDDPTLVAQLNIQIFPVTEE